MASAPGSAPERFRVLGLSTGLSLLLVAGALATPAAAEPTVERDGPVATAIRGLEIGDATTASKHYVVTPGDHGTDTRHILFSAQPVDHGLKIRSCCERKGSSKRQGHARITSRNSSP